MTHSGPSKNLKKRKREEQSFTSSLFTLPVDVLLAQSEYLDLDGLINLSRTCKYAHNLFREPIATKVLQKLLLCILRGQQIPAQLIIKSQPELLFKIGTISDSRRTFKDVSAITLAYGADDVEMLKMMLEPLDAAGRKKALDQINDRFPEKKEAKAAPYSFAFIIEAVLADKDLESIMEKFRTRVAPSVIENGKHFDMNLYFSAYTVLREQWEQLSATQRSLLYQATVGPMLYLLPVPYKKMLSIDAEHIRQHAEILEKDMLRLDRDQRLEGDEDDFDYMVVFAMPTELARRYDDHISALAHLRQSLEPEQQERQRKTHR